MTGRQRHLLVDTLSLVLVAHVQPASEQDQRGAGPLLSEAGRCYPALRRVWADGGYSGPLVAGAAPDGCQVLIVAKPAGSKTFTALPRRWVVDRTFAWLSHNRRLGTRDLETTPQSSRAWIFVAIIHLMCRRLHPV
ncbi:IS4/IS5 family transposase [Hymenobacter elongatus]|uniref:IS4/IS5 family transposase n=1 Tax=Hymenobacter elongatus TaxID=877208 RepID=A0A4Z0PIF7_9BACT|nr:IS4/IS5 family transposase [Hymenobacter elongatus]